MTDIDSEMDFFWLSFEFLDSSVTCRQCAIIVIFIPWANFLEQES